MNLKDTKQQIQSVKTEQRKTWVKPVLQKIRAGDAEVGTRSAPDGAYTTT